MVVWPPMKLPPNRFFSKKTLQNLLPIGKKFMPLDGLFCTRLLAFRWCYVYIPELQRDCYAPGGLLLHSNRHRCLTDGSQRSAAVRVDFFCEVAEPRLPGRTSQPGKHISDTFFSPSR